MGNHTYKFYCEAINEESQEKLDQLRNIASQVEQGSLDINENEIFRKVFGPERDGRVQGYGAGVTPTQLWGGKSKLVCELERRLEESERDRESSNAKEKILEEKVNHLQDLLTNFLGGRMPPIQNDSNNFGGSNSPRDSVSILS